MSTFFNLTDGWSKATSKGITEIEQIDEFVKAYNDEDHCPPLTPWSIGRDSNVVNSDFERIPQAILYRQSSMYDNYFSKTQRWLGHVTSINDASFSAVLQDLTAGGTNELAEFDLEEVSDEDVELLQKGAAFYWSIGYSHENGQISKKSIIRFRRIPAFNQADYDEILDRVSELKNSLIWD
ncbi:hypothetical protein [Lacibacter sp.]|uniref:hypothetical protein n=1 Tax=Lacibacter sp. TaxID=1915409 RepID=UPI002B4AB8E1|nr:hypothetical protein [Lacibacter sp.]HLP37729.1 hypothetical protein [Lacibacter sp.]